MFLVSLVDAQVDVPLDGSVYYFDMARGVTWGSSGATTINNNYIFTPLNPDQGFCIYVKNNNPTNAHSINIAVYQTGDQTLSQFTAFVNKWSLLYSPSAQLNPFRNIPPNSVASAFISGYGSARTAIQLSGGTTAGGSPDTADAFIVQTSKGCGPPSGLNVSRNSVGSPVYCPNVASFAWNLPGGLPADVVIPGVAGQNIYVCSYTLNNVGPNATTDAQFVQGNTVVGSGCTSVNAVEWYAGNLAVGASQFLSGGSTALFSDAGTSIFAGNCCGTLVQGKPLCVYSTNATVLSGSLSYAQF